MKRKKVKAIITVVTANHRGEKNKLYLLLLIQETFTVEYNCTVTTHQRFLIPNHFNIFYTSLPLQLDRAGRTLLSLYKKAFKKSTIFTLIFAIHTHTCTVTEIEEVAKILHKLTLEQKYTCCNGH